MPDQTELQSPSCQRRLADLGRFDGDFERGQLAQCLRQPIEVIAADLNLDDTGELASQLRHR